MHTIKENLTRGLLLVVLSLSVLSTYSCGYIIDGNNNINSKEIVALNREEAKLIVEATTINLNVLNLSEITKKKASNTKIIEFADSLKKDHLEISKKLSQLATKNFITIPDTIYTEKAAFLVQNQDSVLIKTYVSHITSLLLQQQKTLENLKRCTDDLDFKEVTIEATATLETNLTELENLTKEL